MVTVRLYRPFPADEFVSALPPGVRSVAVLDRTKEPGAVGEPLYLDVRAAVDEAMESPSPCVQPTTSDHRWPLRPVF